MAYRQKKFYIETMMHTLYCPSAPIVNWQKTWGIGGRGKCGPVFDFQLKAYSPTFSTYWILIKWFLKSMSCQNNFKSGIKLCVLRKWYRWGLHAIGVNVLFFLWCSSHFRKWRFNVGKAYLGIIYIKNNLWFSVVCVLNNNSFILLNMYKYLY